MTRATSTECLLPLPATKEWGEGRGEGRPCKHCTKTTLTGSRHPSPWPSPRFAGRGDSRRRVAYPTVSSVSTSAQAEETVSIRGSVREVILTTQSGPGTGQGRPSVL